MSLEPDFGRILGSLLGGTIGDALGGVTERSGLAISDDTQLTLATCEAIVEAKCVDPERIAASFLKCYRAEAITGVGSSTLKALRDLDTGGHWALCGARGERAAGNGAAMRIAPLAFVLNPWAAENRVVLAAERVDLALALLRGARTFMLFIGGRSAALSVTPLSGTPSRKA